jgi:RNA recognition motif-containing protein
MRNMSFVLRYLTSSERSSLRDKQLRESYGEVAEVNMITDRDTGRPRGFAFVEMSDQSEATAAIAGLNDQELDGRTLKVNEARQREDRGGGGRGQRRY